MPQFDRAKNFDEPIGFPSLSRTAHPHPWAVPGKSGKGSTHAHFSRLADRCRGFPEPLYCGQDHLLRPARFL